MRCTIGALAITAALVVPAAAGAKDHDRDDQKDRRYYDTYRGDWHQWNSNEDRAYRRYLQDQNQQYRDWNRASRRDQRNYWRWRHANPDSTLWGNGQDDNNERSRSKDRDDRR